MNRLIAILIAAVLICSLPASAVYYTHVWDNLTLRASGHAVQGASIYVRAHSDSSLYTIYSDYTGNTRITQPILTDADGFYSFYIEPAADVFLNFVKTSLALNDTISHYLPRLSAATFEDVIVDGALSVGTTVSTGGKLTVGGTAVIAGNLTSNGSLVKLRYDSEDESYGLQLDGGGANFHGDAWFNDDVYASANITMLDKSGSRLQVGVLEADTLRAGFTATPNLYFTSRSGADKAVVHSRFFAFTPVDVTSAFPNTSDYDAGTAFIADGDTLKFYILDSDPKEWRRLSGYVTPEAGADVPLLGYTPTSFAWTYADSAAKSLMITNEGDGTLTWTVTNADSISWVADSSDEGSSTTTTETDTIAFALAWSDISAGENLSAYLHLNSDGGNRKIHVTAQGEPVAGLQYTVDVPSHPRLFLDATVRAKTKSYFATEYGAIKSYLDNTLIPAGLPLASTDYYYSELANAAFVTWVEEGDTTYLDYVTEIVDTLFALPTFRTGYSMNGRGLACAYDWCYEYLTAGQKAAWAGSLAVLGQIMLDQSNWYATNNMHSKVEDRLNTLIWPGLALYGDGGGSSSADTLAIALCDTFYNNMFGDAHVLAYRDSVMRDGGEFEGHNPYGWTEQWSIVKSLQAWEHATTTAPFDSTTSMAGTGKYLSYSLLPLPNWGTGTSLGFMKQADDYTLGFDDDTAMCLYSALAAAYDDSITQWAVNEIDDQGIVDFNKRNNWLRDYIIVSDTTLMANEVLPTSTSGASQWEDAEQFDVGTVFMREGWDLSATSNDIIAVYRHEQYPAGHAHPDAGQFQIYCGGDILSGQSVGHGDCVATADMNFRRQTVAHNCLLVYNSNDTTWSAETNGPYENSGGQEFFQYGCGIGTVTLGDYTASLTDGYARGGITTFSNSDTLTYIKSNLAPAYNSATVGTVTREFVWVKDHDCFVCFDVVGVDNIAYEPRWVIHPGVSPTNLTDNGFTVDNTASDMFVKFHLPLVRDAVLYDDYDVNGTEYPPGTAYPDDISDRVELTPTTVALTNYFLVTMLVDPTNGTGGSLPTISYGSRGSDRPGVGFSNGDSLFFSKSGGTYIYDPTP